MFSAQYKSVLKYKRKCIIIIITIVNLILPTTKNFCTKKNIYIYRYVFLLTITYYSVLNYEKNKFFDVLSKKKKQYIYICLDPIFLSLLIF
jgi:hypothetical protein